MHDQQELHILAARRTAATAPLAEPACVAAAPPAFAARPDNNHTTPTPRPIPNPQTKPRAEKKRGRADDDERGEAALSQKDSSRILRQARLQQEELDAELLAGGDEDAGPSDLPVRCAAVTLWCVCMCTAACAVRLQLQGGALTLAAGSGHMSRCSKQYTHHMAWVSDGTSQAECTDSPWKQALSSVHSRAQKRGWLQHSVAHAARALGFPMTNPTINTSHLQVATQQHDERWPANPH